MGNKILVIEDDPIINDSLTFDLTKEGYLVASAKCAKEALLLIKDSKYDLLILDVNLPDVSGFDLAKNIRSLDDKAVIMFLTARDLEVDIIQGYDMGGDEYITKPFNIDILHRKIKAIFKRKNGEIINVAFSDGFLYVDFSIHEIKVNNKDIATTPLDIKLLKCFIENKNRILLREILIEQIWDINNNYVDEHTLTVTINRLRNKIEDSNHKYIKTVYGLGYMWVNHDEKK